MYQAPTYGRMPAAPQPVQGGNMGGGAVPSMHRRPLASTNAVNHQNNNMNYQHPHHAQQNYDAHALKHPQQPGQNYDKLHTNQYQHQRQMTPPPKPPAKAPGSPPLPRQNSKTAPPSPPKIITDKNGRLSFSRVGFLGEVCIDCLFCEGHC